jgi:hypothetical protein
LYQGMTAAMLGITRQAVNQPMMRRKQPYFLCAIAALDSPHRGGPAPALC